MKKKGAKIDERKPHPPLDSTGGMVRAAMGAFAIGDAAKREYGFDTERAIAMRRISHQAHDKLRALLNRDQSKRDRASAAVYFDACSTWFAGLTGAERSVADKALRVHESGDVAGAQDIAAKLPPAPKCPL